MHLKWLCVCACKCTCVKHVKNKHLILMASRMAHRTEECLNCTVITKWLWTHLYAISPNTYAIAIASGSMLYRLANSLEICWKAGGSSISKGSSPCYRRGRGGDSRGRVRKGRGSGGHRTHTQVCMLYTAYRPPHTVYSIQTCPHTVYSIQTCSPAERALYHFTHRYVCLDKRECFCQVGMVEEFLQGSNTAHTHSLPDIVCMCACARARTCVCACAYT